MCRALLALFGLGLAAAFVQAAPKPKEAEKFPIYIPTTVDDKSVMVVPGLEPACALVSEVTAVERKGAPVTVTFREAVGGPRTLQASPDGLYVVANGDKKLDPPWCLLRLPVRPGDAWKWEGGVPWDFKV